MPVPVPPSNPLTGLTGPQRDAYTAIKNQFEAFGLGTLAAKILQFV